MDLDIKELESIIKVRDFNRLKGKFESAFFECKEEPYNLKNNSSKFELAKDVSAFANAGKGYILIGIKTERIKMRPCDKVIDFRPLEQNICNPEQYIDVISKWVYPKLKDIEAKWYPTKENSNKGIFVVKIPTQPKIQKPFLISRTIKESEKLCEVLFGYCERKQENNDPKTVVELQQILRDGLLYKDYLENNFDEIKMMIQKGITPSTKIINTFSDIDKRMDAALDAVDMNLKRAMILSAYTDSLVNLETLFSNDSESLKHNLENPPKIRESGFGLRTLDKARIVKGKFCRVTKRNRKVIDLYKDGALVAVLKADEDFLCWAMKEFVINPVPLVESVYNFVQLYELVINDMSKKPQNIYFRTDLRNFHLDEIKNKLVPGGLNELGHIFTDEMHFAPDSNWNDVFEIKTENFEVSSIAYAIVEKIYVYFGIEIEGIPYTKEKNGKKYIDIKMIQSL